MEGLKQRSQMARAWRAGFPNADFGEPCERGIPFGSSEFPYLYWPENSGVKIAFAEFC